MVRRNWMVALLAAVLAVFTLGDVSPAFAGTSAQKLFVIKRSKNADEVHYDARVNPDGTLAGNDTVDGYFMNKMPDGSFVRENLTTFQKLAYGWDTESTGNGTYALKLRAFKDRMMWIVKVDGKYRLQTTIAGKQAYMSSLYVKTDEGGIMPKVIFVDVFGNDAATGAALTEHIVK